MMFPLIIIVPFWVVMFLYCRKKYPSPIKALDPAEILYQELIRHGTIKREGILKSPTFTNSLRVAVTKDALVFAPIIPMPNKFFGLETPSQITREQFRTISSRDGWIEIQFEEEDGKDACLRFIPRKLEELLGILKKEEIQPDISPQRGSAAARPPLVG